MSKSRLRLALLALAGVGGLCLLGGLYLWEVTGGRVAPLPFLPTAPPYTPWPTPPVATTFGYPLLPAGSYGPYVQGVTGPLAVDTRYGAQNPAQGERDNCFRDSADEPVPFRLLYHAGVDLFALNEEGGIVWGQAAHAPVHAVGDGVVVAALDAGADGSVVVVEHRLVDPGAIYSVYWHVDVVQVEPGQPVARGQIVAVVRDGGLNSHLHWEMRTFADGSDLFPPGSAGERGRCNGYVVGVGYTWDDDPALAHPAVYGYLAPVAFGEERRP